MTQLKLAFINEIKYELAIIVNPNFCTKERIEQLINIHSKYIEMVSNKLSANKIAENLLIYDKNIRGYNSI